MSAPVNRLLPDDNMLERLKRTHFPAFAFFINNKKESITAGELVELRCRETNSSQVLLSLVSQYITAVEDPFVIIATTGNCPLLGGIDTRRVCFFHIETMMQLLALTQYITHETIKKRRTMMIFHGITPILLTQKRWGLSSARPPAVSNEAAPPVNISTTSHTYDDSKKMMMVTYTLENIKNMTRDNLLYATWIVLDETKSSGLRAEDPQRDPVGMCWRKIVSKQINLAT